MRGAVIPLILALVLAACVPAGPARQDPALDPLAETTLPPPAEVEPEPSPQEPPEAPSEDPAPLPPPDPPMLAQQRAACARDGGQLSPRGEGLFACVHPTRDAGRSCNAAAQCEGLCLARSGTCAPLAPLFGCQEVFTLPGRRETLCLD